MNQTVKYLARLLLCAHVYDWLTVTPKEHQQVVSLGIYTKLVYRDYFMYVLIERNVLI